MFTRVVSSMHIQTNPVEGLVFPYRSAPVDQ
jgi:hypothetical protein